MVSAVRVVGPRTSRARSRRRVSSACPRAYLEHHQPDELLAELGLDPEGLAAAFTRLLADEPEFPPVAARVAATELLCSRRSPSRRYIDR